MTALASLVNPSHILVYAPRGYLCVKMAHFAALAHLELFRKNFHVIFDDVMALATPTNPSHILVYAPRVVFILLPCHYTNYLEKI